VVHPGDLGDEADPSGRQPARCCGRFVGHRIPI
jgi:hypothetical protein